MMLLATVQIKRSECYNVKRALFYRLIGGCSPPPYEARGSLYFWCGDRIAFQKSESSALFGKGILN